MSTPWWFIFVGAVLIVMAAGAARLRALPLTSTIVYLGAGVAMGPMLLGVFHVNPLEQSALLEILTEIAVLISLFVAGLKLAAPLGDRAWWIPFRLASVSMLITVGLVALAAQSLLGLSVGAAVLLGAVLAPTDPVLASDVQVRHPRDGHPVRFALTGEAGLNDGTAFPMVMLGLGLMGLHPLGENLSRWLLVDVLWACAGGLGVGGGLAALCAWIVHQLHKRDIHSKHLEDFLGLGLMALAYGTALALKTYGFLAVFAAGFMLHRTETYLGATLKAADEQSEEPLTEPHAEDVESGDPFIATVSLTFAEQLERLLEVALIILLGGMLFQSSWQLNYVLMAVLLLLVIRPIAICVGLIGSGHTLPSRFVMAWFGVKGIGSLYYLFYALEHGVESGTGETLTSAVLVAVALSIVVHGITVSPFMRLHGSLEQRS